MDSSTLRSPIEALTPPKPICVAKGTSMREVVQIMKDNHIGCVCVVENRNLVGIMTERDVLTKVIAANLDLQQTLVEEVMTADPEYLFVDDQIAYALNRMHVGGFRHVPLINLKGSPTGVISVRDILGYLVKNIVG
ncbi:MAG: cyclic nucleotide-binding/CBS domain-containing protein [bacterium]